MSFLISTAMAAEPAAAAPGGSALGSILMLVGFVVIFYFLLWRPQSKRAKEHRNLIANLTKGDEVVTSGGIVGRISKVEDSFITLNIADGIEVKVQKNSISANLPKGSMNAAQSS